MLVLDVAEALFFVAMGYLLGIFTWPAVRTGIIGNNAEITRLERRIARLREIGRRDPPWRRQ